ncbi:MAG: terpene cyclase/mutase family protein [Peptostreptococcaceae bacterium]|nr:terpene cyclase/mutase family protein [Peptostreptococcaceae bacterium]
MKKIFNMIIIMSIIFSNLTYAYDEDSNYKNYLKDLIEYHEDLKYVGFRPALALRFLRKDFDIDMDDFKDSLIEKDGENVPDLINNIINEFAIGKDKDDLEDLLEELSDSQTKKGYFYLKKGDEHPANTAWAMILLNMFDYSYDEEDAIDYLLSLKLDEGNFYKKDDLDTTAIIVQALSKFEDKDEVKDAIEDAIKYFEDSQLDDGEFLFMGDKNPYTLIEIIQALISIDYDIYSKDFSKNNDNLVDILFRYYDDGKFVYKTKFGKEEKLCTQRAFTLLAQIYEEDYLFEDYQDFSDEDDESDEDKDLEFEIIDYDIDEEEDAKFEFEITTKKDLDCVLIVCLYDEDEEEMLYYSYNYLDLKEGEEKYMELGFYLPKDSSLIKIFLVDSLKNMENLVDVNTFEVD